MLEFFISRPIFSSVLAIVFIVAGGVCMFVLPIAQYPEITPPQVAITGTFTGSSSDKVAKLATIPLEKQINGVPGSIYMSSSSGNDGVFTITVTFDIGRDPDIGAADILARQNIANSQLPETVQRTGVSIKKKSPDIVFVVYLKAADDAPSEVKDPLYLSNYMTNFIQDEIRRISGVADTMMFGERKYSMRLWLDPDKLASLDMTADDVYKAVEDQNKQFASGQIGALPVARKQLLQYQIETKGRLEMVDEFEKIILRTDADGSVVHLGDVAKVSLDAETYTSSTVLREKDKDGKFVTRPGVCMAIYQTPDANALALSAEITKTLEKLKKRFPKGVEYSIPHDTTIFVTASIDEVIQTLFEAIIIVFAVVYIFMQSMRSSLVPAVTIPVSLVGTFALMLALGFSINMLTLLGLVLAIGLVVDDAIVVVENVQRKLEENPEWSSYKAAVVGMREVVAPVIATTLVLMAVFLPCAFMPGMSGRLYNQFALTIACSVGISSLNSLTLSPALCAILLKAKQKAEGTHDLQKMNPLYWFFNAFNYGFDKCNLFYQKFLGILFHVKSLVVIGFGLCVYLMISLFFDLPTSFVPDEDQGYFMVMVQLPESRSLDETVRQTEVLNQMITTLPGVRETIVMSGLNIATSAMQSNTATIFVELNDWSERQTPEMKANGLMATIQEQFVPQLDGCLAFCFGAPPIPGVGSTGGFEFQILDTQDKGPAEIARVSQEICKRANNKEEYPELHNVMCSYTNNVPNLFVDIDREKAWQYNVDIASVAGVLQNNMGSSYINDFNRFGNVYRVYLQAEADYRQAKSDIEKLYVRSQTGEMIPMGTFIDVKEVFGPMNVERYNVYPSAKITGAPAEGYSSGQANAAIERVANEVFKTSQGFESAWTGTVFQEKEAGFWAPLIFGLAIVFVYLFLAAQYESWMTPWMVLLAVPLAILGAVAAQTIAGYANDVYCQIGMVMLIGLASKNSILIVEFAAERRATGMPIAQAAISAAHLRLRAILMTSFSFILGILPLVLASGPGAASRNSLGTAVFGGMIVSTVLSLIVVPVFYCIIQGMRETFGFGRPKPPGENQEDLAALS